MSTENEFKPFEKEIVSVLAGDVFSEEEQAQIFSEGTCWFESDHEAGYFINVKHPLIPDKRNVIDTPNVIAEVGETSVGFVIFIENNELSIDAFPWGEANVPPDFRERVERLRVGKFVNGTLVER
jgi:hypothetical protein